MAEEENIREFIEVAGDIIGNVYGNAIPIILGTPGSAIVGAMLAPTVSLIFRRTCVEIYGRVLARRERARASASVVYAVSQIEEQIRKGEKIRSDGFFASDSNRSSAEEILEGVILNSKNEHEEKKIKFYSNIFVTAAFDARFTPSHLNYALIVAERLTYRQICLLSLFLNPLSSSLRKDLRDQDYNDLTKKGVDWETLSVLGEIFDLHQSGLVWCYESGDDSINAVLDMYNIKPASMIGTELGKRFYHLMQLQTIPQEDLFEVVELLK